MLSRLLSPGTIPTRSRLAVAVFAAIIVVLGPAVAALAGEAPSRNWPSFRGERAAGVAEGFATPVRFAAESGENILFKTPIPGLAHASPIVWGDRVYLVTAIGARPEPELKVGLYGDIDAADDDAEHVWELLALDKRSGELAFRREVTRGVPKVRRHTKASHASSTPATDGRHLVVFLGSEGLHTYDLDGKLLWSKDLGILDSGFFRVPEAQWGYASSPVLHEGRVIVQCDVQQGSFLAAFDAATGQEVWRRAREEVPTWSTPTVHELGERTLVLVNGFRHLGGYDFATGREIWRMSGLGDIPVPTPVVAHGLAFFTSAHGNPAPVYAVRLGAEGDVSLEGDATANAGVRWSEIRYGAYMQTPIVYGDELYVCRDNGVLSCYDARSGELHYRTRVQRGASGITASPVAADGKLYFSGEMGDVMVVAAGREFELLATNALDEILLATPAISEGVIYFRTRGHLVAAAELGKNDGGESTPLSPGAP